MRVLKSIEAAGDGYRVTYSVDHEATVELRILGKASQYRDVIETRDETAWVDADEGRRLIDLHFPGR